MLEQLAVVDIKNDDKKLRLELGRIDKGDYQAWNGLEIENDQNNVEIVWNLDNQEIRKLSPESTTGYEVEKEKILSFIKDQLVNGPVDKVLVAPVALCDGLDCGSPDNSHGDYFESFAPITVRYLMDNLDKILANNANINGFAVWTGNYDEGKDGWDNDDAMSYDLALVLNDLAMWIEGQCYKLILWSGEGEDEEIEESLNVLDDSSDPKDIIINNGNYFINDEDIQWETLETVNR